MEPTHEIDEKYMARCLQLAASGALHTAPNPMVGAVVVHNGRIIGEGYHRRCGGPHAEVHAIRSVREPALLREATLYVSLEPCSHHGKTPPCVDLIISKGIPRVVVGCVAPFSEVSGRGIEKLRAAGVSVSVGGVEQQCLDLNRRFITFHQHRRPYVTLKWAQSSDGFIGIAGQTVSISSPLTLMAVHRLRALHSAILVGRRTAAADNPTLNIRHWVGEHPLRVVDDRNRLLPSTLKLFDGTLPTRDYTADASSEPTPLDAAAVTYVSLDFSQPIVPQMLRALWERGVQSLLVEGGRETLQQFIEAGAWDEAFVEISPAPLRPLLPGECAVAAPLLDCPQRRRRDTGEQSSVIM